MDKNYKNIIEGYKFKNFRLDLFSSFFSYLKKDNPFFEEFKAITLLLLEDLSCRKLEKTNLVIKENLTPKKFSTNTDIKKKPTMFTNKLKKPTMGKFLINP